MPARPIRVWTAPVDPTLDCDRSWALLDDTERARAARFMFDRDRRHFVAAHALKRSMLSRVCGGDPAAWSFATDPHGKPHVAERDGPEFNISHCQGLVACAISPDAPVGVDIEPIGRMIAPDVVRYALAAREAAWLATLDKADQTLAFVRLWTLKEAFLKATGTGLAQSLQSFAFSLDPIRLTLLDPALGSPDRWSFVQRLIGRTHVLSLATPVDAAAFVVDGGACIASSEEEAL